MKKFTKLMAIVLCMTLMAVSAIPASAEETVEFDFLEVTTISNKNGGETIGRVTQEGRDPETGDGGGAFKTTPQTALDSGGRVICYVHSPEYDSSWLLSYDFELVGEDESNNMGFVISSWGEHKFKNGERGFEIAEKVCAVAGVEPLWIPNDQGVMVAMIPAGHYQGVIDVSEFVEDGFNLFSHLAIYWSGKSVSVNKLQFVSGVEASPTVVPTTTTTEAPTTTTTEAPTTTAPNGEADTDTTTTAADNANENEDEDKGLSTGVIVAIVVGAVVLIAGGAEAIYLISKKKKK